LGLLRCDSDRFANRDLAFSAHLNCFKALDLLNGATPTVGQRQSGD
jgi:hypothetical protein